MKFKKGEVVVYTYEGGTHIVKLVDYTSRDKSWTCVFLRKSNNYKGSFSFPEECMRELTPLEKWYFL